MRIAQVAPLTESVPPKLYGGTERVVSYLTEELVALGHDVTLFASGDSVTAARLESVWPRALRLDPAIRDPDAPRVLLMEAVLRRADEFDVLHFHVDHWPFSLFGRQGTPFLTTLHGRLDLPELQPVFDAFPHVHVASISDAQRRPLPQANWSGTVHHGLPRDLLRPCGPPDGYLAFLGRMAPEKRPEVAIRLARAAGLPIRLAAKVDEVDRDYFDAAVRPLLREPGVEFVGEIGEREKAEFLGRAAALLFPVDWPEPFGMVMIEAMACGTPVVAYGRGSVPEVIEDGVSGFVVGDEAGALRAFDRLPGLCRARVRRAFEARFTSRRMAEDYLRLYGALVGRDAPDSEPPPADSEPPADWEAGLILMGQGQGTGELIPHLGPARRPPQPQGGAGAAQAEVVRLDERRHAPDRTRRQGEGAGPTAADAWTPEDWTGVPGGGCR